MFQKRATSFILLVAVLISMFPAIVCGQASIINTSQLDQGVISVNYDSNSGTNPKVVIKKDDKKYTYDLDLNGRYPLSLGNGEYEVSVLENVSENKYQVVEEYTVKFDIKDSNVVFLQSVQQVNWTTEMDAIMKAASLTKNLKSDSQKATAIYNYIIKNFKYDKSKISNISSNYIPNIDSVYKDSKGICYDFAVLYAAMLRSVGIPTRLVMGYKKDINTYHAWNQVYLKESKKWIIVDTTYDSLLLSNSRKPSMIKSSTQYQTDKVY